MVHPNHSEVKLRVGSPLGDTYEMVNDPSSDSIISWSENGQSFIVWKPEEFARDFLPKLLVFPDNFSAFTRMLYRFGFRKVGSERWEFADEYFVRGKPELIHYKFYSKKAEGKIAVKISKIQKRKFKKATKALVAQLQSLQM